MLKRCNAMVRITRRTTPRYKVFSIKKTRKMDLKTQETRAKTIITSRRATSKHAEKMMNI